jgi:hypothetical protein
LIRRPTGQLGKRWAPVQLFGKQEEAVRAIFRSLTTYFVAAWGTGKSVAIAYAAWLLVMRYAPGVDGCFVAPTTGQLLRTLVKAWIKVADPRFYRLIKSGPEPRIEWFGGTPATIHLFSGDAPERIEGVNLGWGALEEMQDLTKDTVERVEGRLRDAAVPDPRLFGAGLPETGTHLHQDLVVKPVPGVCWVKGQTADNPHLHPTYIERLRRRLPKNLFKSRVLGIFASPEGLIYPAFNRDIHVGRRPFREGRRLVVGIDFNVVPYIPAVLFQDHEEVDETWGVGEITIPEGNTEKLAAELVAWCQAKKLDHRNPEQVILVPDATGKGRSPTDGSSCHDALLAAGFHLDCPEANPEVRDRDNAVAARLETADGRRRLFFDGESCPTTIAAFEGVKHEGRKRHRLNHILDAAGYPIHRYHPVLEGDYGSWAESLGDMKTGEEPLIVTPGMREWSCL